MTPGDRSSCTLQGWHSRLAALCGNVGAPREPHGPLGACAPLLSVQALQQKDIPKGEDR